MTAAAPPAATAPRFHLAVLPTPLQHAPALQQAIGAQSLWIKRDDLSGFGTAGNKTRPLEFLMGAAIAAGADTVVVTGAPTSNFCMAAALAARTAGLRCRTLHSGPRPDVLPPNARLAEAFGAELTFDPSVQRHQLDAAAARFADRLAADGYRPYPIPRGGATAVGALGFAAAAAEIATQAAEQGLTGATIVLPTGSGGTQSGLVAGLAGLPPFAHVVGASVSRPVEQMTARVTELAGACGTLLGTAPPAAGEIDVRDAIGPGFGIPSSDDLDSVDLAARTTGLLLDATYGAKAMTVCRRLAPDAAGPIIFWATGGLSESLDELPRRRP